MNRVPTSVSDGGIKRSALKQVIQMAEGRVLYQKRIIQDCSIAIDKIWFGTDIVIDKLSCNISCNRIGSCENVTALTAVM